MSGRAAAGCPRRRPRGTTAVKHVVYRPSRNVPMRADWGEVPADGGDDEPAVGDQGAGGRHLPPLAHVLHQLADDVRRRAAAVPNKTGPRGPGPAAAARRRRPPPRSPGRNGRTGARRPSPRGTAGRPVRRTPGDGQPAPAGRAAQTEQQRPQFLDRRLRAERLGLLRGHPEQRARLRPERPVLAFLAQRVRPQNPPSSSRLVTFETAFSSDPPNNCVPQRTLDAGRARRCGHGEQGNRPCPPPRGCPTQVIPNSSRETQLGDGGYAGCGGRF